MEKITNHRISRLRSRIRLRRFCRRLRIGTIVRIGCLAIIQTTCAMLVAECRGTANDDGEKSLRLEELKSRNATYLGALKEGKYHGYGVLMTGDSVIYAGQWSNGKRQGYGHATDAACRKITGRWNADTLVSGTRTAADGEYTGGFDKDMRAEGHGVFRAADGSFYEGHWLRDKQSGKGFAFTAQHKMQQGEWKEGAYRGERITYTTDRIYGIDISKHQHVHGRRTFPIHWKKLRITHLGTASRKAIHGTVDYPISFIYIKSTEGSTLVNRFYKSDYRAARAHGFRVGTYHFFSIHTSPQAQAAHFIRRSLFSRGDFPPVLDVEPTPRQIEKMGGAAELFRRIRIWMNIVERHTGTRPVLYISQQFVNRYLPLAPDIKQKYDIWIARYGEYKPDVHLVYWQLCADGRVSGIRGAVDINVFNGYKNLFDAFVHNKRIK